MDARKLRQAARGKRQEEKKACLLPLAACLLPLALLLASSATATEIQDNSFIASAVKKSGQPVPRFASLKSEKVHMRAGPGFQYPILWIYQKKGLPVEITAEFDTWRRIRDADGDEGWVHLSNLSGKRGVLVKGEGLAPMYKHRDETGALRAKVETGAQGKLLSCRDSWCKVEISALKGYMKRRDIWGALDKENFD
jgi:SH3-like domain-containing protein